MPNNGTGVNGMLLYSIDKDSNGDIPEENVVNRRDAKVKYFDNCHLSHTVKWCPWLVNYDQFTATNQPSYVLPRDRWLNCQEAPDHRFGSLRVYFQCNDGEAYGPFTPTIAIQHRIVMETQGQITVLPSSVSVVRTGDGDDNQEIQPETSV